MLTEVDNLPAMPWKYKLAYLIAKFHTDFDQTDCPVQHSFTKGKYIREMRIPAGTLFIGRTHLNGHVVQLVSGSVVNISEDGKREIEAPYEFHSHPGYQATFYAITDVIGRTVHENPEDLRDVQALEDRDFEQLDVILARGKMVAEQLKIEGEVPCLA